MLAPEARASIVGPIPDRVEPARRRRQPSDPARRPDHAAAPRLSLKSHEVLNVLLQESNAIVIRSRSEWKLAISKRFRTVIPFKFFQAALFRPVCFSAMQAAAGRGGAAARIYRQQ